MHALHVAGAEVLVQQTIRRLADHVSATVICLDEVGTLGDELRQEGVPVTCLQRRPGRDWGAAWRLARALDAFAADVVHAHQYTPFFYSALAKSMSRCRPRLIFTEHGRHFPDRVSSLRRLANRWVFDRWADEVNAVCAFSAQALADQDGFARECIGIIPNGLDLSRYPDPRDVDKEAVRARLGLEPAARFLVHVARMHPVKDQETLLRAFAEVARHHADVHLLMAGDGQLRQHLEKVRDDLGLGARVRFLGVRRDVPELLQAADIFVLSSLSEAASLTLLEAMASGLPVVATDVGGNPEIVRDGKEGLLVPRQDPHAMAQAIDRLLQDPGLGVALGQAGRERVRQHYLLDQTIASYDALYRRLADRA